AWPARWDKTSTDFTAPVETAGILRRLNQDAVLRSPLYRSISGQDPIAYWPMEDGSGAARFVSALPGGVAMPYVGMTLAADSTCAGSAPLPTIADGGGTLATIPASPSTSTGWTAAFAMKIPSAPSVEIVPWAVLTDGTAAEWAVVVTPASP